MNTKKLWITLGVFTLIAISLYMFYWLVEVDTITIGQLTRGLSRRASRIVAIVLVSISIGLSSLYFQTLTQNRILTPSIIGIDATFVLTQTLLVFFLGTNSIWITDAKLNFILTTLASILVALSLFGWILKKGKNNIALLLLVGLIIRTLMTSFGEFLARIMDPETFNAVTSLTLSSLSNMDLDILYVLALPIALLTVILLVRMHKTMDVIALGEDISKSLGVRYYKVTNQVLFGITILMSIITSLVGPLMFLGLLTVNLARELLRKDSHIQLIMIASLIGIILLTFGQFVLQVFELNLPLAVVINLIGGFYMIVLLIKGGKRA